MKTYTTRSANQPAFIGSDSEVSPVTVTITGEDDLVVSDGYHTFDELYEHRFALFIALCRCAEDLYTWRSRKHADGTMFAGWFIAGVRTAPTHQITYHLPERLWNRLEHVCETLECAPQWDGHTSSDVIERLMEL